MADRFHHDIELPDLASDPPTPEAGFVQFYGRDGRPRARASSGRIFDLGNVLESARINGAEQDRVRIETHTVTTNGSGEATVNFAQAFADAPSVQVQAFTTLGSQATIAEVVSVSASAVSIRTYRTRTQGVLLGGTINPTRRESTFCHITAIGVPT